MSNDCSPSSVCTQPAQSDVDFVQRLLIKGWQMLFDSSSDYYLPKKLGDSAGSFTNLPSDPSSGKGFDLGESIPDFMGALAGAVTSGNAEGYVTKAETSGFASLAPNVDSSHAYLDGLSFGPQTGPSQPQGTLCASLKIPKLSITGNWVIHQPETLVPGSGCGSQPMAESLAADMSDDDSEMLRQFRQDLLDRGGNMGKWYVAQWTANQAALEALIKLPEWNEAVMQYHGDAVWNAILEVLHAATTGSVSFPEAEATNALALVSAVMQIAQSKGGAANQLLAKAIEQILPYVSAYTDNENYDQVLSTIAGQVPPASTTFKDGRLVPADRLAELGGAYNPYQPIQVTQSWDGTFSASGTNITANVTVTYEMQSGDKPPVMTCTGFCISIPDSGWSFDWHGSDLASKFIVWIQKTFDPKATEGINESIELAVKNQEQILTQLGATLTQAVASIWSG